MKKGDRVIWANGDVEAWRRPIMVTLVEGPFQLKGQESPFWLVEADTMPHATLQAESFLEPIEEWVRCEGDHQYVITGSVVRIVPCPGEHRYVDNENPAVEGHWEKRVK